MLNNIMTENIDFEPYVHNMFPKNVSTSSADC